MPIIKHMQFVKAPIEVCFDLARNVDIHIKTTAKTNEKAVVGLSNKIILVVELRSWQSRYVANFWN